MLYHGPVRVPSDARPGKAIVRVDFSKGCSHRAIPTDIVVELVEAKAQSRNTDPASFEAITVFHPDGKTEEKLDFFMYGWFDYMEGKTTPQLSLCVSIMWKGRWFGCWGDESGPCPWGRRPQDAPVL